MIESRSQVGHRRRMALSQSLAQSVSSLCSGAESGIKRIVVHWGSAAGVDLPRSEPKAEVLLLNKSSTAQYWNPVWAALEQYWKPICKKRKGAVSMSGMLHLVLFFQAEDGIRDLLVTGVQ